MTNAVALYQQPVEDGSDQTKVSNRTSHAVLAIASILVFGLITIGFRVYAGCEPTTGIVLGLILFGGLGVGWYNMLSKPSAGRLADLFGISNRILPASATADKPMACIVDPSA